MTSRNTAPFTRLEKGIAAADSGSIRHRWEYGRLLLVDPEFTTPAGNLRHGVLADLIEAARKAGKKLSEREVRYRLEAGRTYPCDSQIRHADADFDHWTALREAAFPAYEAEDGEEPFDPRTPLEKARAAEKQLAFGEPGDPAQLALFEWFPDFDTLATISELRKHAEDVLGWSERQAKRSRERIAYVDRLSAAVNGDESRTWEEANAALLASGDAA